MARAPRRRTPPAEVVAEVQRDERRIQFFRIRAAALPATGRPIVYDATPALTFIDDLPFTRTNGRYLKDPFGDDDTCCWVDSMTAPQKLRLGIIRRSNFPQVEQAGQLSPLDIARTAGLAEYTHMMFLGDNILGAEFNFYGPRASRLATYINLRQPDGLTRISVNPLLRDDVQQKLDQMTDIKILEMKVRRSYIDELKEADESLGDAFEVVADIGGATEIEVILRPKKRSNNFLSDGLIELVKKLNGNRERLLQDASKLKVEGVFSGNGGAIQELDVLSDAFVATKQIVLLDPKSRALDSTSAFSAIQTAYQELRPQLLTAMDASS